MSKTYRDVIRGKYNHAVKVFENNPNNYEKYIQRGYQYNPGNRFHLEKITWVSTRIKLTLQNEHPMDKLSYMDRMRMQWCMSKNPSWWNKLFHIRPNRKRDRNLLATYDIKHDAEKDAEFSLHKKPNKYYW